MFDWTFVTHYAPFFVSGAEMTLFISVFGIVLSIVVGLICASIEIARIPVLKQIVRVYIELSRNTPLLVQLYFLYFGLPKLGVVWSAEQCAIVGLGFLGGLFGFHSYHAAIGVAVHRILWLCPCVELEFGCDRRMRVRVRAVGRRGIG